EVCDAMDIPREWTLRCEESCRVGHDGTKDSLASRFDVLFRQFEEERIGADIIESKLRQLGSLGGGNHFAECEVVRLAEQEKRWEGDSTNPSVAQTFGLKDGNIAFLTHCGSRGFGNLLAQRQFALLKKKFQLWGIPFPGGDANLVYAPLGTQEADDYIDDMTLGANFATLNHLLINLQVLNAFQEVFPGVQGKLVYYISHNIAKREVVDGSLQWVHRKGATRAFPANHFALAETPFAKTGHPILLPGNPLQGSSVMVALEGAKESFYSVNHGAGRAKGRRDAMRLLDQNEVDSEFDSADVLTNCRQYPRDEAPAAYKDFNEVLRSVELAGLAREVARLKARFVIKDSSTPDD
ncbi:MAG: RtcB family protein, partial [Thermoguttaceae bacterium]|nr:RtcB family protein [Thermoguttaceae bacterium]